MHKNVVKLWFQYRREHEGCKTKEIIKHIHKITKLDERLILDILYLEFEIHPY